MDELLREPQDLAQEQAEHSSAAVGAADWGKKLADWKRKAKIFWHETGAPLVHKLLTFGREHPITPPMFLAAAAAIGIGATVATVYDLSYVVFVDGQPIGAVREPAVFEQAVESVETRATRILGHD